VQVVVGRVVRPHGVRGEVVVDTRTDRPEQRFAQGQTLATASGASLVVSSSRPHAGRWLLRFAGVEGRDAVEALRGTDLMVETAHGDTDEDDDLFADVALIGLQARLDAGEALGTVRAVEHLPMQDLLVIRTTTGRDVRVPFVRAIVPDVDVGGGWLRVRPPTGLLEVEERG
jgi:16S rRNA processing protein RimM